MFEGMQLFATRFAGKSAGWIVRGFLLLARFDTLFAFAEFFSLYCCAFSLYCLTMYMSTAFISKLVHHVTGLYGTRPAFYGETMTILLPAGRRGGFFGTNGCDAAASYKKKAGENNNNSASHI